MSGDAKRGVVVYGVVALLLLASALACSSARTGPATRARPAAGSPAPPPHLRGSERPAPPESAVLIHFIDVGEGAATLVLGPEEDGERTALLVDSGAIRPPADRAPGVEPIDSGSLLHTHFERLGVWDLEFVVLTHYHADHMGGFVTVSHSYSILWDSSCRPRPHFPLRALVDTGPSRSRTASVREWMRCTADAPRRVSIRGQGDLGYRMDLGGGWEAAIVAAHGWALGGAAHVPAVGTENDRSLAVLVTGPSGFDLLVTGDLSNRSRGAEDPGREVALGEALAARGVDIEILAVGHHGSATSSAPRFLGRVRPEVAVISTGKNRFGHPACRAYESLVPPAVQVLLQTERGNPPCAPRGVPHVVANGTIEVEVAGERWVVRSYGEVSPLNGHPTRAFSFPCTVGEGCDVSGL